MDLTVERARLFLALWPNDEQRRLVANHVAAWRGRESGHWYASQDWHVTVWFLGALERPRWSALADRLAVPFKPFELWLDQPQRWPHGLAVLAAQTVPPPLTDLRQRLGQAAADAGLPLDPRPYRPHVTLARRADEAQPPDAAPVLRWAVNAYALVCSTGDARHRYEVIRRYDA